MSNERPDAMRGTASCASTSGLDLVRRLHLPEWVLALAAGLAPQLARAELTAAGTELAAVRSEPGPTGEALAGTSRDLESTAPHDAAKPASESLELRLSYRAPSDCPSSGAFLAALQEHVAAGGGGAIDAAVNIVRASASQFELALRLQVAGKSSESVTRADSCSALVQLAALNAAMARTPALDSNLLAAPPSTLEPESSPRREAATPPLAAAAALEADAGDLDAAGERGDEPRGLRPFMLGEVRTQSGLLPRQSWGRGVTAGIARGPAMLRLSATSWQTQRGGFAPEGASEVSLDFEQRSLELAPCAGGFALARVLRIDGCALLAASRVKTEEQGARWIGSLGASALATLFPWRGLRLELEGSLSFNVNRPMFGVQSDAYLYQPGVLQPGARLALGWEFGGGT